MTMFGSGAGNMQRSAARNDRVTFCKARHANPAHSPQSSSNTQNGPQRPWIPDGRAFRQSSRAVSMTVASEHALEMRESVASLPYGSDADCVGAPPTHRAPMAEWSPNVADSPYPDSICDSFAKIPAISYDYGHGPALQVPRTPRAAAPFCLPKSRITARVRSSSTPHVPHAASFLNTTPHISSSLGNGLMLASNTKQYQAMYTEHSLANSNMTALALFDSVQNSDLSSWPAGQLFCQPPSLESNGLHNSVDMEKPRSITGNTSSSELEASIASDAAIHFKDTMNLLTLTEACNASKMQGPTSAVDLFDIQSTNGDVDATHNIFANCNTLNNPAVQQKSEVNDMLDLFAPQTLSDSKTNLTIDASCAHLSAGEDIFGFELEELPCSEAQSLIDNTLGSAYAQNEGMAFQEPGIYVTSSQSLLKSFPRKGSLDESITLGPTNIKRIAIDLNFKGTTVSKNMFQSLNRSLSTNATVDGLSNIVDGNAVDLNTLRDDHPLFNRHADPFLGFDANLHKSVPASMTEASTSVAKPRGKLGQSHAAKNQSGKATERQYYNKFVHTLLADEGHSTAMLEDDDEDDEVFQLSPNSDEQALENLDEPAYIPALELYDLYDVDNAENEDIMQTVVIDHDVPASFDRACVTEILSQVAVQMQLLVQSLALCGEIRRADHVWLVVLKLMMQLDIQTTRTLSYIASEELGSDLKLDLPGMNVLMRMLDKSPLKGSLVQAMDALHCDAELRPRSSIVPIPFILKHSISTQNQAFSPAFWNVLSIFSSHPVDEVYLLIPSLKQLAASPDTGLLIDNCSAVSPNLEASAKRQSTVPDYAVRLEFYAAEQKMPLALRGCASNVRHDSFWACEDELLLLGLERFGTSNWEMVQAHYVPTRTPKQLHVRTKNLTSRRAPANPLKEFWMNVATSGPMSKSEQKVLIEAVRLYGTNWQHIQRRFLPNRPVLVLQRIWARLDVQRMLHANPSMQIKRPARPVRHVRL